MSISLRHYSRGYDLIAIQTATGEDRVYHFDHQGTTQCLTDAASGAVTDRFASDAWGVEVRRTGDSINRQWYVGNFGYYRDRSEIVYVRERFLASQLSRWLSLDPLFENYTYVLNTPVARIDPSGLKCLALSLPDIPLGANGWLLQIGGEVCFNVYTRKCPPCSTWCMNVAATANIRWDYTALTGKYVKELDEIIENIKGGRTLKNLNDWRELTKFNEVLKIISDIQNGNALSAVSGLFGEDACHEGCVKPKEPVEYMRFEVTLCGVGVAWKCSVSNSLNGEGDPKCERSGSTCLIPTFSITVALGSQGCFEGEPPIPCPVK